MTKRIKLSDREHRMLDALEEAIARVKLANEEDDPILSAWLPGACALVDSCYRMVPQSLKLEAGKTYRTFDGKLVTVHPNTTKGFGRAVKFHGDNGHFYLEDGTASHMMDAPFRLVAAA